MRIVFCNDALNPRRVDEAFEREFSTAHSLELATSLVSFEAIAAGDFDEATCRIARRDSPEPSTYRGWMLTSAQYGALYARLLELNIVLINTPEQYAACHHLPNYYAAISTITPRSLWIPESGYSVQALRDALASFGTSALIVKDYVKSQKHYWREACFIPDASDATIAERVVERFRELQAESLVGGVVLREYASLAGIGTHPRSGMPLSLEFRVFVLNHAPALTCNYWEGADYPAGAPPLERLLHHVRDVNSNFFSMDVAQKSDGTWIVMELGDGQVSGIPDDTNPVPLFEALKG